MTDHREEVEQLLAEYRRSREQLADVQQRITAISESVSSADGLITATVGGRGVLTDLTIDDDAYQRYRPRELAAQIVRLTGEATAKAFTGAGEVLAPALPSGTDPQALLLGTADLTAAEITPPEPADSRGRAAELRDLDDEESFEDSSWLDDSEWQRSR